MGAIASTEMEPDGGDMDDAWMDRAWKDGVPFTLLHDDAFVAEKYQELRQNRPETMGLLAVDDEDGALEMTGTDELPMDELDRMSDAARIKLFTLPRGGKQVSRDDEGNAGQSDEKRRRRPAASALTAMQGTALARESRQRLTSERRRVQQCLIVRDYMARLASRMEKRAKASRERERQSKQSQEDEEGKERTEGTTVSRSGGRLAASAPGQSLFQVGSFRMQLEMLRAFRSVSPSLFETSLLVLVQTVLEFRPFALHRTQEENMRTELSAVNELLIDDTERFSREMLALPDLSEQHRGLVLLLLLALGVSSGRSGLLVEFVAQVLCPEAETAERTNEALLKVPVGDRVFHDWVAELLTQMESYRVNYKLGTLTEDCFLKQINFKLIRDDTSATNGENNDGEKQSTSVATDGSYVYTWNIRDGLSKIGTGQNFTVAGRVYATVPSEQFLRSLRQPRTFYAGFYGSGQDATALIQSFAEAGPRPDELPKTVRQFIGLADDTVSYRLYVRFILDGKETAVVLKDDDKLCFSPSVQQSPSAVQVQFAFYGAFIVISEDALGQLKTASSGENDQDASSGVLLDAPFLQELLNRSSANDAEITDESELILLYSASTTTSDLVLEKFTIGEVISSFEECGSDVYHSSIVLVADQILLSLLCPTSPETNSASSDTLRHRPRTLTRVSCADLSLLGDLLVSSNDLDDRCNAISAIRGTRPLFSYVTEGRLLYEIEMSADRFRVRVFNVSKNSSVALFLRSFDVQTKQIQCATFVSCFLKILKTELGVGDLSFQLPSFYTNGSYIGMILPSITAVLGAAETQWSMRTKFDGLLIDCETGFIVSSDEVADSTKSSLQGREDVKSFERTLPGGSYCFDASNNIIWVVNSSRATMSAYRNPGRRLLQGIADIDTTVQHIYDQTGNGFELIGQRVLKFLARHADDAVDEENVSSPGVNSCPQPFAVETSLATMSSLLRLAENLSKKRNNHHASETELESLRSCLCVLRSGMRDKAGSSPSSSLRPDMLVSLQPRFEALLTQLIHEHKSNPGNSQTPNIRVVSAALALSASAAHLVDTDVTAQVERVVRLVQKYRSGELSPSETIIAISLLRELRKTVETGQVANASVSGHADTIDQFSSVWNELVGMQEDRLKRITKPGDELSSQDVSDDLLRELIGTANCFVQSAFSRAVDSTESLELAFRVVSLTWKGINTIAALALAIIQQTEGKKAAYKQVERTLRCSVVRNVAPVVFSCATLLLRQWGDVVERCSDNEHEVDQHNIEKGSTPAKPRRAAMQQELGSRLSCEAKILESLFTSLHALAVALKADERDIQVATVTRTTRSEVMETSHEYENNLDVTTELRIPGATQITITFDPQSRTEFNYDYVTFFKDKSQTTFYGEQYYSGRDADFNWPGVNGLPPLVIDRDHCFVYFHTDASNTDWGYKFTAVGEVYEKASAVQRHWLSALTELALNVLDEAGKLFVEGTQLLPISETEAQNDGILHSELLRHGVGAESEQNAAVLQLLREFVEPPQDSDAVRVLRAMEQESGQGRLRPKSFAFRSEIGATSKNPINTAIRAATAAILHHNMWGMDAYALAQNLRSDVSEQLLRGWKNAQKMRDWFHLGDAAAEAAHVESESSSRRSSRQVQLRRQPSAYKGMSDEALQQLSKNVVERAVFLLEMTPMAFSYVSGAKRRWNFLAKYGSALGGGDSLSRSSSDSTLGKWYNLLDELQEATELRSLLTYRRSSSERRKSRQLKSVTEQVLEFIQSDIDVSELRQLITIRNQRARYRAQGFNLYARMLQASFASTRLRSILIDSWSSSLRQLAFLAAQNVVQAILPSDMTADGLAPPRVHFGTLLSGCDGDLRKEVNGAFGLCLSQLIRDLAAIIEDNQNISGSTDYVVSTIKAICIDYDIDDMYLLQESNVLPLLLRLLGSDASRVRRSAQVLQNVFLSRLVKGEDGDEGDGHEASLFQKQLFATVGLQLEGITSALRDLAATSSQGDSYGSIWRYREQNLARPCSSLTVPVSKDSDLKWNHSIMLWLYISSSLSTYAVKIGDEVRRGPSWSDASEGDGLHESGTITAITSPTTVRVKWSASVEESEHTFDPKQGQLDVILTRESVGGVIFCKGTKNLAKDTSLATPWSHFGLFLNDRRQLSYRISCGAEKECVYETNYELDANDWAHVAIIQNEEVLKFYVNGLVVSQHILDPFLVLRRSFSATESKILQSPHPVVESADQYWPIHIPGASKIRVTFDPLSEIDQSSGFVRFYKNARCNEIWGEDKYTGRYHDPERNFPGALSNRHRSRRSLVAAAASQGSLDIPSDRCLVYFNHAGDTKSWGFRLLATPEFACASSSGETLDQPSLNDHPIFIGESPGRIMDAPAARCWLLQPEMLNASLTEDEIVEAMHSSCPSMPPKELPLDRALHVIGLLHTCSESSFGRELIATPENVGDLITIAFDDLTPVDVKCASVIVLQQLCASLSVDFLNEQFQRTKPLEVDPDHGFVGFVFRALVSALNVWANYAENRAPQKQQEESTDTFESMESMPPCPMEFQISATESTALATAYMSLLRRLADTEVFADRTCQLIESSLLQWRDLSNEKEWTSAAGQVVAALSLLGGSYTSVCVGGRVKCCANIDGKETIECGYLLRYQQTHGQRTARILFDCDPVNPVDVPVGDVAHAKDEDDAEIQEFVKTVASRMPAGSLARLYQPLLTELKCDMPAEDVCFKPKVARKENVEVLESEHPYDPGEDVTYTLRFQSADEIMIFFDSLSTTAGPNDFISFLKRSDDNRQKNRPESNNGKAYWGEERYYGESFPGVRGAPPLRIPASSVDIHFHTDSSSMGSSVSRTEWGFKLTAHAYEETLTHAPEIPPTFCVNAMNDIRARAIKSLHTYVQALSSGSISDSHDTAESLGLVLPHVVGIANAPDDGRPTQCSPRTQVFESKHPYANSVKECMAITFSGAARLVITFDKESHTELNSDYVCFFKDKSLTDRWGQYQYSGGPDSGNWPGVGDRPPLYIPSDSFTLLWTTDASNTEWGWRFTVSAEYPVITPLALRLDQLNKQAEDMWQIFYEGIGAQRTPYEEEFDGFEKTSNAEELRLNRIRNDPTRSLLFLGNPAHRELREDESFRVLDSKGVDVHQSPTTSATVIGHLDHGKILHAVEEKMAWLKIRVGGEGAEHEGYGWVKRRSDDKLHVTSFRHAAENEDVLVLGVDDKHIGQLHNINSSLDLDNDNVEHDGLVKFVSQFSYEALKGQSMRYQSLAYDTHRALAIKYARATLATALCSVRPSNEDPQLARPVIPLQVRDFGSSNELLLFLSHVFADKEDGDNEAKVEESISRLLVESSRCADTSTRSLVDRCVEILESSRHLLPTGRGAVRILESRHPYVDDVDQYWQLAVPGAKQILVYFDARSKSETGCDWVCFYKNGSDRGEYFGEAQYSGRNGSENWPGCGGRPPLAIDADSFEVHFHSDANQNDWGFKLFAVGVFDDDTEDLTPPLDEAKLEALVQLMDLSLRVLLFAVEACTASAPASRSNLGLLHSSVFSPRVVRALLDGLSDFPQQVRPLLLRILQSLLLDSPFTHSLPSSLVERLRNVLVAKIRAQFVAEDRLEAKSEYLQMLVECALFVDLAIDSACFLPQYRLQEEDHEMQLELSAPKTVARESEQARYEWARTLQLKERGASSLHLLLQLRSFSVLLEIDLTGRHADGEQEQILHWESDGKIVTSPRFGSQSLHAPLRSGDVISIHVDFQKRVLELRKNLVCVHSFVSDDALMGDVTVAVSSVDVCVRASSPSDQVILRHLPYSPLASLPTGITPNWYNKLCDAMAVLLDFKEHRVAAVIECESEHPLPLFKNLVRATNVERVTVENAVALEVRFDRRTILHDKHRLRFSSVGETNRFEAKVVGIRGTNCDEAYPGLFLLDPLKRTGILKPGDRVIRSSDWCYGDEDGGRGCVGVVEEIVSWNGRNGCGVRVQWEGSSGGEYSGASTDMYRYGYDGFFDVQLIQQPRLWDAPLVVPGNALEFALDCIEDAGKQPFLIGDDQDFLGTLQIDPSYACALVLDVRKTKWILGDDCTIECWLCLAALTVESQVLLEISTLDPSHSIVVYVTTEGKICVQVRMDGELTTSSSTDLPRSQSSAPSVLESQWFHFGVVCSSSKLLIYVNGERTQSVLLDHALINRSLYVASLVIGGRVGADFASPALQPARGHVCDVQVWDVAFHSEQVHSHANGIDGVSPRDGWQSSPSSMPQAPRKLSRQSQLTALLPPPSPPRSPQSPSRGMNAPPHQKKWIMVNRTGRDIATVRANCAIDRDSLPSSQPLAVYFEAHVLSTGRLSVGWASVESAPSSRDFLLGDYSGSIGIELPRRRALFNGDSVELENPSAAFDGLRSPRRRSSSSSSIGTGFADVFSREGDVIGCAFVPTTNDFSFYLNGELLIEMRVSDPEHAAEEDAPVSQEQVHENFDSLVGEMLTLGFSREASEDALEASASTGPLRTVQRAIDWLIDESTTAQRDSGALSSPRRLSANSPFASPRRRLSSNSSAMAQLRRVVSAGETSRQKARFVPAATLGAQGAQGVAWNLGQRPFKYAPDFSGVVLSAMQAANCVDRDGESVHFEVFDHSEKRWERVAYRHRLQDLVPTLLARWRLDEGSGTTVYDSSGRDQVGTIQIADQSTVIQSSSAPLSPRSRRPTASISWWDANCLPPVAVTRVSETGVTGSAPSAKTAESAMWGYRFYIIPHFSEESIGRRRFQTQAHRFAVDGPMMELRHDQQIIKYVNKVAVTKQLNVSQVLRASWSELAPPENELVKWPVLVEIATGVSLSTASEDSTAAVTKAIAGSSKAAAMERLAKRFKLLQELNSSISRLLPFTAFAPESSSEAMRLEALIREQRYRILHAVKRGIWDEALKRTTEKAPTAELIVNRPKAMRHRVAGKVDAEGRFALFSQAFRQLNGLGSGHFRRAEAVYHVQFLGENAQDAGGPYRETLAQFADELHSSQLPLLIASSNAQHNVGAAREKWVLNPSATGATQLQMLEFLGKLMGSAMRSQEYLSLQIALLIWKQLVSESVSISDDLTLVDSMIVSSMQKIRSIDQFGVSPEMFEDIVMETFTTLSTDNRIVPLKPHGASIPVTFETRIEFADLVEAYRLHEFDDQVAALLRGLAKVVPVRMLSLFTGAELEQMVCGSPEVDVDLLQRCTEYSSCHADDEHIVWFWQVLRDFSHDERSVFLRFVWGRSRLPPNEKEFPQRFKLQSFNRPVPRTATGDNATGPSTALDGYLPIAHTCFFSVELPRYSSQDVLREKLVYAMYNCQEIDGDGDSVAANQLGWEE